MQIVRGVYVSIMETKRSNQLYNARQMVQKNIYLSRDCILSGYMISHVINTVFHHSTLTQISVDGTNSVDGTKLSLGFGRVSRVEGKNVEGKFY